MKYLKLVIGLLLVITTVTTVYYTHRLWVFAGKVSKSIEYTYAAIDCLIMQDGQASGDINILFKGYKTRKAYYEAVNKEYPGLYSKEEIEKNISREMYNGQIPECKKFYSQYRCWELDPHDSASLDGCGLHFQLTQDEINKAKELNAKNDYNGVNALMDIVWDRKAAQSKKDTK